MLTTPYTQCLRSGSSTRSAQKKREPVMMRELGAVIASQSLNLTMFLELATQCKRQHLQTSAYAAGCRTEVPSRERAPANAGTRAFPPLFKSTVMLEDRRGSWVNLSRAPCVDEVPRLLQTEVLEKGC